MFKRTIFLIIWIVLIHPLYGEVSKEYYPVIPDISDLKINPDIRSISYLYLEAGVLTEGSADFIMSSIDNGLFTKFYLNTKYLGNCISEASIFFAPFCTGKMKYSFNIYSRLIEEADNLVFLRPSFKASYILQNDTISFKVEPSVLLTDFSLRMLTDFKASHIYRNKLFIAESKWINTQNIKKSHISITAGDSTAGAGIFFSGLVFPSFYAKKNFISGWWTRGELSAERCEFGSTSSLFNLSSYYSNSYALHSYLYAEAACGLKQGSAFIKVFTDIDTLKNYTDISDIYHQISASYSFANKRFNFTLSLNSVSNPVFRADYIENDFRLVLFKSVYSVLRYTPCFFEGSFCHSADFFLIFGDSRIQSVVGIKNIFSEKDQLNELYSCKRSFAFKIVMKDASIFNHY